MAMMNLGEQARWAGKSTQAFTMPEGVERPEIDLGPDEVPGAPPTDRSRPSDPPPRDFCGTEPEEPGWFDWLSHKWYLLTREPWGDPDSVDLGPDEVPGAPTTRVEVPDLFKGLFD